MGHLGVHKSLATDAKAARRVIRTERTGFIRICSNS